MRRPTVMFASCLALLAFVLFTTPLPAAEVMKEAAKPAAAETAKATDSADKAEAKKPTEEKAAEKQPTKVRLAHIKLEGALPESAGEVTLFGDLGVDLRKTIARLDKAADDKTIAAIVLEIGDVSLTRGKLNELRDSIQRIRKNGKKIYAQMESADGQMLLLASACDEIVMPEAGMVLIPGVQLEIAYYKDLLEKIGVEADMLHVGDSKGAAEPLMRRNMSDAVRRNLTALVDDLYDQMLTTIAADRELQIEEVRKVVDEGLLTANDAKRAGLIDRVEYFDEFRQHLSQEYKADKLVYVVNYGKQEIDTDFSGPMGMMKLFQSILGASTSGDAATGPKIALVYAVGPIMSGKSESGLSSSTMGSDTIVEALHKANNDKDVKAIVLRINSPGGSALASDLIWRATQAIDRQHERRSCQRRLLHRHGR